MVVFMIIFAHYFPFSSRPEHLFLTIKEPLVLTFVMAIYFIAGASNAAASSRYCSYNNHAFMWALVIDYFYCIAIAAVYFKTELAE